MSKKLQINFTEEAWNMVEALFNEANENFDAGHINYSDLINEMLLNSKIDIKALQLKHTDLRRSLKSMAAKENVDIDQVIKSLMELKGKSLKRKSNSLGESEVNS